MCVYAVDPSRHVADDTASYEKPALALLHGGNFSVDRHHPDQPEVGRTPGYPLFIAVIYAIFGEAHAPILLVQIIISALTLVPVFLIGKALWTPRVALFGCALFSLDWVAFLTSQMILSETLFVFLYFVAMLGAVRIMTSERGLVPWALITGLALAAATLTRPVTLYLILPFVLWIVVYVLVNRRNYKQTAAIALLVSIPLVAGVMGWQVRNQLVAGTYEISNVKAFNLLNYRAADIIARRDGVGLAEARDIVAAMLPQEAASLRKEEYDKEVVALTARLMGEYPGLALKGQVKGTVSLLLVPGEGDFLGYLGFSVPAQGAFGDLARLDFRAYLDKWLVRYLWHFVIFVCAAGYLLLLYLGSVKGALEAFGSRDKLIGVHLFIWMVVAYFVLVSGGPEGYSRLRAPVMPLFSLYAGAGLLAFCRDRCRLAQGNSRTQVSP